MKGPKKGNIANWRKKRTTSTPNLDNYAPKRFPNHTKTLQKL